MSTVACERNLPLKVEQKQGIVSILGSNSQATMPPAAASYRRTLSADMSSKKWLAENGFTKHPAMKRVSSSAQLSFNSTIDHHSSSSEEEEEEFCGKKFNQIPKQDDVWSSIVSQKKTEELPPPYVHPLVKKSSSSLCSKSLEICTESLGSETGSDKVTLCEPLETGSEVNGSGVQQLLQALAQQEKEISQGSFSGKPVAVVKYNNSAASNKKMQSKSFPPPIPLLAGSSEGPSLHMHSHRENGRLVLEAISVPSTKKLQAHRQDGRLRLTLIQPPTGQQNVQQPDRDKAVIFDRKGYKIEDSLEDVFDILEQEDDENDIHKDDETTEENEEELKEFQETVMEHAVTEKARGVIYIHRSALMMKKIMGLENQNPKWSPKFNHAAAKVEPKHENEKKTTLPQSLPPRPRTTRSMPTTPPPAASFNAYEYFWRPKPATTGLKSQLTHCSELKNDTDNIIVASNKPKSYEQQEPLMLRNCRKARRSLLSWDAHCIATT